mgnify:CR=1 FL=1
MMSGNLQNKYFEIILSIDKNTSSEENLKYYLHSLFKGVEFRGKRFLDIGGGYGKYSFFAACQGASTVVCLEPESAGSTAGTAVKFERIKNLLGLNNIILETRTIQEYQVSESPFDIILLHDSINHLDESACMKLPEHEESKMKYLEIFNKISQMATKNAEIIICDCSRYNLFGMLKLKNPFDPSIEWYKHQSPKVWTEMLLQVGFVCPEIRWNYYSKYLPKERPIALSALVAYLTSSHFWIKMHFQPEQ